MRLAKLGQRGDTMIEVLIAIAVVSLILTAAYVITSKNTAAIQGNQERIQAQHIIESQIETLKGFADTNSPPTSNNFCFKPGDTTPTDGTCGYTGVSGSGATYTVVVVSPAGTLPAGADCAAPSATAYTVCAYWDNVRGSTSTASMYYRTN